MKLRKPLIAVLSVLILATLLLMFLSTEQVQLRNIILLIPDGMSVSNATMARWYMNGQNLAWDSFVTGLVRTHSADAPIADSAPAGTAYATGFKSHTGYVGVLPDVANMPGQNGVAPGYEKSPIVNILEASKLIGKSTGLVVTCNMQHATPADFSAHYPNRSDYETIAEQQTYENIDVLLGGGYKYLQNRKDGEDLLAVMKQKGYAYVTNTKSMNDSKASKLLGFFAPDAMDYDLDRVDADQPSLAEMTQKALGILSTNQKGFFLMVEGSQIDWANHANDPVGAITDILAFNDAVKAALQFAMKDKNTAVIVVADHSTGGFSIGCSDTSSGYDKKLLTDFVLPVKYAHVTGAGLEKLLNGDMTSEQVKQVVADNYGIKDLSDAELKQITDYLATVKADPKKAGALNYVVGPMISKRALIGWTTNGHVGEDVSLAIYNPKGYVLTGVVDNTDVGVYMAKLFGVDLPALTKTYFIEASAAFKKLVGEVTIDVTSDPTNPVLKMKKGAIEILIQAQKDYVTVNGKQIRTKLLNVYNGTSFYVSQDVLNLVK